MKKKMVIQEINARNRHEENLQIFSLLFVIINFILFFFF